MKEYLMMRRHPTRGAIPLLYLSVAEWGMCFMPSGVITGGKRSFAVMESRFWCLYQDKSCDGQSKFRLKRPPDAEVQLIKRRTGQIYSPNQLWCVICLIYKIPFFIAKSKRPSVGLRTSKNRCSILLLYFPPKS